MARLVYKNEMVLPRGSVCLKLPNTLNRAFVRKEHPMAHGYGAGCSKFVRNLVEDTFRISGGKGIRSP